MLFRSIRYLNIVQRRKKVAKVWIWENKYGVGFLKSGGVGKMLFRALP